MSHDGTLRVIPFSPFSFVSQEGPIFSCHEPHRHLRGRLMLPRSPPPLGQYESLPSPGEGSPAHQSRQGVGTPQKSRGQMW